MPTSQAATYASAPMLIGSSVPITKRATSARMATSSGPKTQPFREVPPSTQRVPRETLSIR